MKTAAELKHGERARIKDVNSNNPSYKRLIEIGFTPGQEIELVNTSVFDDPIAFAVRGTLIAIRRNEADCIILS